MTTIEEVKTGLEFLKSKTAADRFREATEDFNRTVQFHFTDLDYKGFFTITDGTIDGPHDGEKPSAEIKVEMTSDTFAGLLRKEIDAFSALIKGHVKVKASFWDLMKLKNLG